MVLKGRYVAFGSTADALPPPRFLPHHSLPYGTAIAATASRVPTGQQAGKGAALEVDVLARMADALTTDNAGVGLGNRASNLSTKTKTQKQW